jgi:RHH-type transcriptional regulator, proline utilization regulon repressor / proline dehydrogenase / delta 1-pyrroline-5-carboxylate dehydrogenase
MASPSSIGPRFAALFRAPEPQVLAQLLPAATLESSVRAAVTTRAPSLLAEMRAAQADGWVNQFLQQYRLNSREGVALLSLAEAFLRVPDRATADLLIRDKLSSADWSAHAGQSDSTLVNSATWGLVMTRALVGESEQAGILRRLVARAGEPFVRQGVGAAMRLMGEVFVMGRTIEEALERADTKDLSGFTCSFDMLGEAARTQADAERYFTNYAETVHAVGAATNKAGHSISVKLSALHPRFETAQADLCVPRLTDLVRQLARAAASAGVGLTIDAEESERLMMSLDIIRGVAEDPALKGWDGLGMAAQAYGKRCAAVVDWAQALAEETNRRMTVRLVKGAYWDSEIKRTQERGLADYPLFTRKAATDVSYLACAKAMLESPNLFPAFASHNALTVATIVEWAGTRRDFEFQRLQGMGAGLYERLVQEEGYQCRIYAPVGGHRDLLAYLVRRLLENGANSSFVHQLADPNVTDAMLLADPVAKIKAVAGARHPSIPLPVDVFGAERRNSTGLDLGDATVLAALQSTIATLRQTNWHSAAIINGSLRGGVPRSVHDPADPARSVGTVVDANGTDAKDAIDAAYSYADRWAATSVAHRAACLERLADLLEADRDALLALCVAEAGKTFADAVGEVREAVDFCRYYAVNARAQFQPILLPGPTGEKNELRLIGRGVFACIAPWNFPLAIFLGQVVAALVAGNTVVAKPAPQTPLIAARAVHLAHQAGIAVEALHLLPGGPDVGEAIIADARVSGVAFTGSTGTAKRIARAMLADDTRPIIPFIAETGGLNAMIVDSTALPEQVVADVISSAFSSAGQRCSALRLLLLQEDIADHTLAMLMGAMDTLVIGNPADPRTDIGPVIDRPSQDRLNAYRDAMRRHILHELAVPKDGYFVAPTLFKLDKLEDLTSEWFGPLLHVATWTAGTLEDQICRVNASGFGLTMGLHSRLASASDAVRALAKVGNLYINRSIIGAVVGSQPFGGEGLSGTGPKAGGPHYLLRFATERTVSIDTTSAGGNASLLSMED